MRLAQRRAAWTTPLDGAGDDPAAAVGPLRSAVPRARAYDRGPAHVRDLELSGPAGIADAVVEVSGASRARTLIAVPGPDGGTRIGRRPVGNPGNRFICGR